MKLNELKEKMEKREVIVISFVDPNRDDLIDNYKVDDVINLINMRRVYMDDFYTRNNFSGLTPKQYKLMYRKINEGKTIIFSTKYQLSI